MNEAYQPSQLHLLRDKVLFYRITSQAGFYTPEIIAEVKDGDLFNMSGKRISWESMKGKKNFFVKDLDGEYASFVKHVNDYYDLIPLHPQLVKGNFFIVGINQCKEMLEVNPHAVSTLRLNTIMTKYRNCIPFATFMRIGTERSHGVDNWAVDGLAVGFTENGRYHAEAKC